MDAGSSNGTSVGRSPQEPPGNIRGCLELLVCRAGLQNL